MQISSLCPISMAWSIILYVFTPFLATVLVYYIFNRSKKRKTSNDGSPLSRFTGDLRKVLFVSSSSGWHLKDVQNGHRFWEKQDSDGGTKVATSAIVPTSLNIIANAISDPLKNLEWDPFIKSVLMISKSEGTPSLSQLCSDVISITPQSNRSPTMDFIKSFFYNDAKLHSRTWEHIENVKFWLHSAIVDPDTADPLYTMFMVFPIEKNTELCEVTIVCDVVNPSKVIPGFITGKLAGLKEYVTRIRYTPIYPEIKVEDAVVADTEDDIFNEIDGSFTDTKSQDTGPLTEAFVDVTGVYLKNNVQKYKPVIEKALKKLMEYYHAQNGQNGWSFVANIKDVEIYKKPASPRFSAWDCSRGTCVVNVPIHYLIAYCSDLDHNSEYDDMFLTGHILEQLGDLTTIAYLEYKAIWPVSGRDFCSLHATRILPDNIYTMVARSITHPSCPPCKKYVRGKILMGGFVMKVLSEDPPSIRLTYITHVDLAGSVPARIVNKVTASQPLSVGIIKKRAEELYKEALDNADVESKFKTNVKLTFEKLERARKIREAAGTENTSKQPEEKPSSSTTIAAPTIAAPTIAAPTIAAHPTANGRLRPVQEEMPNSRSIKHSVSSPQFADTTTGPETSPFDNITTQYKTIGNQASAGLLQEVFEVAEVDITKPISSSSLSIVEAWEYRGTEKDVMMFRKLHANEKMHSCIGKGIIPCSPATVWEAITTPERRYNYDNMLKETRILERISGSVMIEYLHFETVNCFQKQARDFVVLRTNRIEKDKYLLAAISINYDKCPEKPDVKRGKVMASGWVIEPLLHNGQLFSMVTYLSQVNPGGNYPASLTNLVTKKQPLCIAYLRKYLENHAAS